MKKDKEIPHLEESFKRDVYLRILKEFLTLRISKLTQINTDSVSVYRRLSAVRRMKKFIFLLSLLLFLTACPAPQAPPPGKLPPTQRIPATAEEAYYKGLENLNRGNFESAIQFFNLAIQKNPKYAKAFQGLGDAYAAQEKYELAEKNYLEALELDPRSLPTLLGLGSVQVKQGNHQKALETYRKALEISPQNPVVLNRLKTLQSTDFDVHFQKGLELKQQGQLDAALEEFQAAQRFSPQQVGPLVEIGYIFLEKQDYEEAEKYFQRALTLNPDFVFALLGAGRVRLAKGDLEKAREYFEKVLGLDPENKQAQEFMEKLRESASTAKPVPKEYQEIATRQAITRGDLAVLILIGLDLEEKIKASPELVSAYRVQPISDIAGHPAKSYIVKVTAYGLMEVFPDHTFQPDEVVTRGELAATIDRIFKAFSKPLTMVPTPTHETSFKDVLPENIYYQAVVSVSQAGIMNGASDSEFGLDKPVSGSEAMGIIAKVKEML